MSRPFVAFHFALVQDVAVLRPLAHLAASLATADVRLVVSQHFAARDIGDRWGREIVRLGAEIGVEPFVYASPIDVYRHLGPGPGMMIAGSESPLAAHADSHLLFRALSGRIRTVTLQHGLECIGFLHNRGHDEIAGPGIAFAADIAVAWFEKTRMRSVAAGERAKLYVAGPTTMIPPAALDTAAPGTLPAMVCDNLHSVRFPTDAMRDDFLDAFVTLADRLAMIGDELVLRPHPAGRFTERNGMAMPANVTMRTDPLYDLDLAERAFAISGPSTILLDFIVAGVPVAVWADPDGTIDVSAYHGLPMVATADDWWRFAMAARWERAALRGGQKRYVEGLGIPRDVRGRYAALLALA